MADMRISDFPVASTLAGGEKMAAVQATANVAVTPGLLARFAATNAPSSVRLTNLMLAATLRNPAALAEGGSALATITPKVIGSGTAGLTQPVNQYSQPSLFRWYGGAPFYATSVAGWTSTVVTVRSAGNVTATQGRYSSRFAFQTDAASVDFIAFTGSYRVLVNGQYVNKAVRSDAITAGGYNRLNIALADTSRQLRRFDIETDGGYVGGSANGSTPTIMVGPNDTVAPLETSARMRIAVVGDSFTTSTGTSWGQLGWAVQLGYILGGVDADVRQIAIGGTGYVNDAGTGTQQYTFIQHVDDLNQSVFDLVVIAGGINDSASSPVSVQAAALAYFQAARARQPNAVIAVFGSWAGATGPSAGVLAVEAAIQAAFVAWADPLSFFVPVSTDPNGAWINATNGAVINAAGAPGGGNPDGTHPGNLGHFYLAQRAAAAIRTGVRGLLEH